MESSLSFMSGSTGVTCARTIDITKMCTPAVWTLFIQGGLTQSCNSWRHSVSPYGQFDRIKRLRGFSVPAIHSGYSGFMPTTQLLSNCILKFSSLPLFIAGITLTPTPISAMYSSGGTGCMGRRHSHRDSPCLVRSSSQCCRSQIALYVLERVRLLFSMCAITHSERRSTAKITRPRSVLCWQMQQTSGSRRTISILRYCFKRLLGCNVSYGFQRWTISLPSSGVKMACMFLCTGTTLGGTSAATKRCAKIIFFVLLFSCPDNRMRWHVPKQHQHCVMRRIKQFDPTKWTCVKTRKAFDAYRWMG